MKSAELRAALERCPLVAAIQENAFAAALRSPVEAIFDLSANVLTVQERAAEAHAAGKVFLVHIDLADGVGKDKSGIAFLAKSGVDGIISTRSGLIRAAKDAGLVTVQRFFALDSKGVQNISDMIDSVRPDVVEIMPGVIGKVISRFANGNIPVIAGGLVETKAEVTTAIACGALGVSTGCEQLWYL